MERFLAFAGITLICISLVWLFKPQELITTKDYPTTLYEMNSKFIGPNR